MEKIIISLKVKTLEQIAKGLRHFEYRRTFKDFTGTIKAYIYVDNPVGNICAYMLMDKPIIDTIDNILEKITKQDQPSMMDAVRKYLTSGKTRKNMGIAIPIHDFTAFTPINLRFLRGEFNFRPLIHHSNFHSVASWIEEQEYPELFKYLESKS